MDNSPTVGSEALIPNPALAVLGWLIGTWRTTGTHALLPGTTLHGRTTFSWHLVGAFILMQSEIDEPEVPNGLAVISSDDAAGAFTMQYFDERAVSRKYEVNATAHEMVWHRNEAGFAQRQRLTFADSGSRLIGSGEMSRDGGEWEGDLSLTYERTS